MIELNGYNWRNFSCNCQNNDPNGIRWVISGQLKSSEGSCGGILEWCTSFEDATIIYNEMSKHLRKGDKISIDPYSINCNNRISLRTKLSAHIGDTVIIKNPFAGITGMYGNVAFIGKVVGISKYNKFRQIAVIPIDGFSSSYNWFSSYDILGILLRSKTFIPENSYSAYRKFFNDHPEIDCVKNIKRSLELKALDVKSIEKAKKRFGKKRRKFNQWIERNIDRLCLNECLV